MNDAFERCGTCKHWKPINVGMFTGDCERIPGKADGVSLSDENPAVTSDAENYSSWLSTTSMFSCVLWARGDR